MGNLESGAIPMKLLRFMLYLPALIIAAFGLAAVYLLPGGND